MTTFPKHPAAKAPHQVAEASRQVTRAHARLDEAESKQSQHTAQIATANTNIATNTANITTNTTNIATGVTNLAALNTRLGGTATENFLGTLGQMSAISTPASSGVGTLAYGGASGWNNSAIDDFNAVNDCLNSLVSVFVTLLTELVNQKYVA